MTYFARDKNDNLHSINNSQRHWTVGLIVSSNDAVKFAIKF